jgi:hypothetical protein
MEPTIEEKPAAAIATDRLRELDNNSGIASQVMEYLPFYRFLCEKDGKFTEHVYSALPSTPFPLFSVPSGKLTAIGKSETLKGPEPRKKLPEIIQKAKLKDIKSMEEMLLIYLPFWKITLSTGESIWIDAVQGRIVQSPTTTAIHHKPSIYRKLVFSGVVVALFVIGIQISPFLIRLLVQMAGAGLLFFLYRKELMRAT